VQLAQRGVRVAIHYRSNRAAAEECLAGLAGSGHALFAADLSEPAAAAVLWQQITERLGAVDVNFKILLMKKQFQLQYTL